MRAPQLDKTPRSLRALPEQNPSRVIIDRVEPRSNRFPAKASLGTPFEVSCILLCDSHDKLAANVRIKHIAEDEEQSFPLEAGFNDLWRAEFMPKKLGVFSFRIEAWIDRWGSWKESMLKRLAVNEIQPVDLEIGIEILESWRSSAIDHVLLDSSIEKLKQLQLTKDRPGCHVLLESKELENLSRQFRDRSSLTYSEPSYFRADTELSQFSSWYEFFPRSVGDGSLRSAANALRYAADLGFDIVYLPPVHPIGKSFRKGANNSLSARPEDPGSPWAIGSDEGGHKALHPDLGSWEDFDDFVKEAERLNLKIALDIAFQCSPNHPYVNEHPEWFRIRPDGSIQYAENPPKKYQDIYPLNFETENWKGLWLELQSVFEFWMEKNIRVFRVDNPHTKSLAFWEWLIPELKSKYPDSLFLSEAFTRPHLMARLAKLGFDQSYTYFAWRNSKSEIISYCEELTQSELADFFRPNFWPNTPDILTSYLQFNGRAAFIQRLILAATLSSNYGIYGPAFELMENRALKPGSEEYWESEKYQIRAWDVERSDSLAPLIRKLNRIRKENSAFRNNKSLQFQPVDNEQIIAYTKESTEGDNLILVVVNLDPHHRQAGTIDFQIQHFGIPPDTHYVVEDLLTGDRYYWRAWKNYVELNPHISPAHIFRIDRKSLDETGDK